MGCFAMFRKYFLSLIAIIFISLPSAASAQTKVGYFNELQVLAVMPDYASGLQRIENDYAGRANAVRNLESEIQVLDRDIRFMGDRTDQEANSARLSLVSKKAELAELKENLTVELEVRRANLHSSVRNSLIIIVRQYADEKGFDLILTEGAYYISPRANITSELIRRVSGN